MSDSAKLWFPHASPALLGLAQAGAAAFIAADASASSNPPIDIHVSASLA